MRVPLTLASGNGAVMTLLYAARRKLGEIRIAMANGLRVLFVDTRRGCNHLYYDIDIAVYLMTDDKFRKKGGFCIHNRTSLTFY